MVDALRRAKRLVAADGLVVDLHPTATPAAVRVASSVVGQVDSDDAPTRHAAADVALNHCVAADLFTVVTTTEFNFHTYADSVEELRDHVTRTWRSARISDATVEATRKELKAAVAGIRPCIVERVRLTTLRPR